ncbi:MAG: GNAT family N-acetyltransferase [Planctomycetaceae bacterium]
MQIPNSERLKFHFVTAADEERFFQLDKDPEVMKYVTGRPMTREDVKTWCIPRLEKYACQERGWGLWGMTRLDNAQYVGWILVRPMHFFEPDQRDDNDLELGWRLFQSEWGKGYATEGARAVMDTLRTNNACTQFSAVAVKENTASTNIMKKLGMSFVNEEIYTDPDIEDQLCVVYSCSANAG